MLRSLQYSIGASAVVVLYTVSGMADLAAQERLRIISHDVDVRSCAASRCPVVAQLPILSYVNVQDKVAARNGEADGDEDWAYVTTVGSRRGGPRGLGWLIDRHVGYPDSFAPVRSWQIESFEYCSGDYCPDFRFTPDGQFSVMSPACFDGLCPDPPTEADCSPGTVKRVVDDWVHCLSRGRLYRAGDVIRAGGPDSHEFLYFDKRGRLCADPWTCRPHGQNRVAQ